MREKFYRERFHSCHGLRELTKILKGQCVGIVYLSEVIQVDYIIKTNRKLSDNIRIIIIMICGKE